MSLTCRNNDFMRECHRQKRIAFEAGEHISIEMIVSRALQAPAPGYYLDYHYAQREVSHYLAACGGKLPEIDTHSRSSRRRMIHEIAIKCLKLMQAKPHLTLSMALTRVLAFEPASSFFISQSYGVRLYYRVRALTHRRTGRLRSRHLF